MRREVQPSRDGETLTEKEQQSIMRTNTKLENELSAENDGKAKGHRKQHRRHRNC